jgi:hypothetical protein
MKNCGLIGAGGRTAKFQVVELGAKHLGFLGELINGISYGV